MNEWHFLQRNGDFTLPSNWRAFKIVYWYSILYNAICGTEIYEREFLEKSDTSFTTILANTSRYTGYTPPRFDRSSVSSLTFTRTEGTNCYDIYYKV